MTPEEFQRLYGTDAGHTRYGMGFPTKEELQQYGTDTGNSLLEGVATLADLYDTYAVEPLTGYLRAHPEGLLGKAKQVHDKASSWVNEENDLGISFPGEEAVRFLANMALGSVDPGDATTYLPFVGPAIKAGMHTAKQAVAAGKNAANVAKASKGLPIPYADVAGEGVLGIKDDLIKVRPGVMADHHTADVLAKQMRRRAESAVKDIPVYGKDGKPTGEYMARTTMSITPEEMDESLDVAEYLDKTYRGVGTAVPSEKAMQLLDKAKGPLTTNLVLEDVLEQMVGTWGKGLAFDPATQLAPTAKALQEHILDFGSKAPHEYTGDAMDAKKLADRIFQPDGLISKPHFTSTELMHALSRGDITENQALAMLNLQLKQPNITQEALVELNNLRQALYRAAREGKDTRTPLLLPEGIALPQKAVNFITKTSRPNANSALEAHQNMAAFSPNAGSQMALDPRIVAIPARITTKAGKVKRPTVPRGYDATANIVRPMNIGELLAPDGKYATGLIHSLQDVYGVDEVLADALYPMLNAPYGNARSAPMKLQAYHDALLGTKWDKSQKGPTKLARKGD